MKPIVRIIMLIVAVALIACVLSFGGTKIGEQFPTPAELPLIELPTEPVEQKPGGDEPIAIEPEEPVEQPVDPDIPTDEQSQVTENEELMTILDELSENVRPGTAGSSLIAVKYASALLDWAVNTPDSIESIKATVEAWLDKQEEDTDIFEQLNAVDGAISALLSNGAEEQLEVAGVESKYYPWCSAPVPAIEAVMEAAGLR